VSELPLEARALSVRHPQASFDAVRDVTLSVAEAEIVALCGRNGSGKSTLLAALAGVMKPERGEVTLYGEPIGRMRRRAVARRLAFLPQQPQYPEGLTIESLVRLGRRVHGGGASREDRHAIEEAIRAMELGALRTRPLERISGGERRRAFIAMVLAQETPVVLLDEPTAALDLRHEIELLQHLREVRRARGLCVVVAMHDLTHAANLADRMVLLARGRLYEQGAPRDCLQPDRLRDVFGIEARVSDGEDGLRIEAVGTADPLRSL